VPIGGTAAGRSELDFPGMFGKMVANVVGKPQNARHSKERGTCAKPGNHDIFFKECSMTHGA